MDRYEALGIAAYYRIPTNCDFHSLNSDAVERITEAADSYKYRKPRNANGSRARYFHAFLCRIIERVES